MSDFWMLYVDCNRIQDYIFSATRLKAVTGASFLAARVNVSDTLGEINNCTNRAGKSSNIKSTNPAQLDVVDPNNGPDVQVIYSTSGITKALFKDEKLARDVEAAIHRLYRQKTDLFTVSSYIQCISLADLQPAVFSETIERGEKEIRKKKDQPATASVFANLPFTMRCEIDSTYPACDSWHGRDGVKLVSKATKSKLDTLRQLPVADRCLDFIRKKLGREKLSWPEDLEKMVEASGQPGAEGRYMALVVADGNGLGSLLSSINSPVNLQKFSQAVEECCEHALKQATDELCSSISTNIIPAQILIFGGDDIMIACDAASGLALACKFCSEFHTATRDHADLKDIFNTGAEWKGISACAGVAIAKHTYPIYRLAGVAEGLMANAKKQRLGDSEPGGMVNFVVVRSSNVGDIGDYMKTAFDSPDGKVKITLRPYSVESSIQRSLPKLLHSIRELKKPGFPTSKLKDLEQGLRLPTEDDRNDWYKKYLERLGSSAPREKLKALVTQQVACSNTSAFGTLGAATVQYSPLLDAVEIFEFVR